jgi:hypothetical protein
VGQTINYALPYPECDPPLRKDAADVAQMRDLAVAIDTAVTGLYDDAANALFSPDTCRMSMTAGVATTGQNVTPFLNSASFDNTPGAVMADTGNGLIQLVEPGRYWIGAYCLLTSATELSARMRFLFNGAPVTNFQSPSAIYSSPSAYCYANAVLSVDAPTQLQVAVRHSASAALSWTYQARLWAVQMLRY